MIKPSQEKMIKFLVVFSAQVDAISLSGCASTKAAAFHPNPLPPECRDRKRSHGANISSVTKPLHSGHIGQAVTSGGLMPHFHIILL